MRARVVPQPSRTLPRATARLRQRHPRFALAALPFTYSLAIVCVLIGIGLWRLGLVGERLIGFGGADPFDL